MFCSGENAAGRARRLLHSQFYIAQEQSELAKTFYRPTILWDIFWILTAVDIRMSVLLFFFYVEIVAAQPHQQSEHFSKYWQRLWAMDDANRHSCCFPSHGSKKTIYPIHCGANHKLYTPHLPLGRSVGLCRSEETRHCYWNKMYRAFDNSPHERGSFPLWNGEFWRRLPNSSGFPFPTVGSLVQRFIFSIKFKQMCTISRSSRKAGAGRQCAKSPLISVQYIQVRSKQCEMCPVFHKPTLYVCETK